MRKDVQGGTDVAAIVLFWPAHLPEDADDRLPEDASSIVDELAADGKLVRFPCDSDGTFKVAIYVDEEPPPALTEHAVNEAVVDELDVPASEGFFGGVEGLARDRARLKSTLRSACGAVELPPGCYRARLFELDPPEEHENEWVRERAGPLGRAVEERRDLIGCFSAVALLAALGLGYWQGIGPLSYAFGAVAVVLFAVNWRSTKTEGYRMLEAAKAAYEEEFASYLLRLESIDGRARD